EDPHPGAAGGGVPGGHPRGRVAAASHGGAGRLRTPHRRPPGPRLDRLHRLRGHGSGQPPVPPPGHTVTQVGPAGGRVGRGRRGVHRPHARHRLDLGQADMGHVVGLGRPPDPECADAGVALRLRGPSQGRHGRRSAGDHLGRHGRRGCSRRADQPLRGDVVAHAAPGSIGRHARPVEQPRRLVPPRHVPRHGGDDARVRLAADPPHPARAAGRGEPRRRPRCRPRRAEGRGPRRCRLRRSRRRRGGGLV
ncbi:MAG: Cytochrome c-type biogenesis protein CcmC, putative heme lyase for CcmE, partial [uncultured Acidimicrobiales bacterium]